MFRIFINHLQGAFPPASNPTTHRLEQNWQYNYNVGFLKYRMLPEDGF
jgi:hypothetical protein